MSATTTLLLSSG